MSQLKALLNVQITKENLGVTLYCPELNIHVAGKTEAQARKKFVNAIFEYYDFLERHDFKNEAPYNNTFAKLGRRTGGVRWMNTPECTELAHQGCN